MNIENLIDIFLDKKENRLDGFCEYGYSSFFYAYIGIENENVFNYNLYKVLNEVKNNKNYIILKDGLSSINDFDLATTIKSKVKSMENINFDLQKANIKFVKDDKLNIRIIKYFNKIIKSSDEINISNYISKLWMWITIILGDITISNDNIPKCIFYGNIKKHEMDFLYLLNLCGFDILYINPENKNNVDRYDINIIEFNCCKTIYSLDDRVKKGEVISKSIVKKTTTITAEATKRVENEILSNTGMILNSWQLQDKEIITVIINSTVEEIKVYINQPFNMRPGYKMKDNSIESPVFFTKIIGVYEDEKLYLDLFNTLKKQKHSYFIELKDGMNNIFYKKFEKSDYELSYSLKNNKVVRENIIENSKYGISILDSKLQNLILNKYEDIINSNLFIDKINNDEKIRWLYISLNLNQELLLLLENFDYGKVNPKFTVYINKRIHIDKELIYIVVLLHKLGFDVFIVTPSNSKDVEKYIVSNIVNTHKLDKITLDYELKNNEELNKNKSIFDRFTNIFKK